MYDLKGSKKLLSSTEDRPIFEDLECLRPRTSKTVLEAKDVLEAVTSALGNYNLDLMRYSSIKPVQQYVNTYLVTVKCLIDIPTRITRTFKTLIDHIYSILMT